MSRSNQKLSRWLLRHIRNDRGQSIVEYLIVSAAIVASLITAPSIYQEISGTLKNKYKSYAFGVAVSDPPRKTFDDQVKKDADEVKHILDILKDIEHFFENL